MHGLNHCLLDYWNILLAREAGRELIRFCSQLLLLI
jgi:hypothetical protein